MSHRQSRWLTWGLLDALTQSGAPQLLQTPLVQEAIRAAALGKAAFDEGSFREATLHFRQAHDRLRSWVEGEQPTPVAAAPLDQPVETWTNSIGIEFVKIPPGKYVMASSSALARSDEYPHEVEITHWMLVSRTEITQEQYLRVLPNSQSQHPGAGGLPVVNLSWFDAVRWIEQLNKMEGREAIYHLTEAVSKGGVIDSAKVVINEPRENAGYRLLREAEWEYVARGGVSSEWPFIGGLQQIGEHAWYQQNSRNSRGLAGVKTANAFGLSDMLGGVLEWCEDWYAADYYRTSPAVNPAGPELPVLPARVARGGHFASPPEQVRPSTREGVYPATSKLTIGFRIVRVLSGDEIDSTLQDGGRP